MVDRFSFRRIHNKLLVAILAIVLAPLAGTGLYGNWYTSRILKDSVLAQARADIGQRADGIESYLNAVRTDVQFLHDLNSLQHLVAARAAGDVEATEFWRQAVEGDFLAFAQNRTIYSQVRYIAEDGQEFVRVDLDGSTAYPMTTALRQDKSHRYYFADAMRLDPGEILVSPMDLNREFGKIELPYQPVIRYAAPVFDRDGLLRGIVILNVLGDRLLNIVRSIELGPEDQVMVVDGDGHFLLHPDTSLMWGGPGDLATGHRLHDLYPRTATSVLAGQAGEILGDRALVFVPVFPPAGDNYWTVVYDSSLSSLFAPVWNFRATAALILVLAAGLATIIATALAHSLTAPIRTLQTGVEQLGSGAPRQPIEVTSKDEIGQLATTFNDMASALERSDLQRRQLIERLINAQEDERKLVAYDLHDGLIQRLVGARFQLSNYAAQREQDTETADHHLQRSVMHLGTAIAEGRRLIEGLRPTILDDLGLGAAVEMLGTQTSDDLNCPVQFMTNLDGKQLPQAISVTAFRIAQEALGNVRKHSQTATLAIDLILANHSLCITIQDWGVGFDASCAGDDRQCVGLVSMRERAHLVGGHCRIESTPGAGTTVSVSLPLDVGDGVGRQEPAMSLTMEKNASGTSTSCAQNGRTID